MKVFKNKDIAPDITLINANQEVEAFRVANTRNEATTLVTTPHEPDKAPSHPQQFIY